MPITKTTGYLDSQGVVHASIEQARRSELERLIEPMHRRVCEASKEVNNTRMDLLAAELLDQSEALLAILTTGPTSRPSARKKAGTTSPKRAAKRATEAQATAGFKAMREATQPAQPVTEAAEQAA